jgi:GTP cyclohydrolase II
MTERLPELEEEVRDVPLRALGRDLLGSAFRFAPLGQEVLCLHTGELEAAEPVPVRLHSSCITGEVFGSGRCDCDWQLRNAIDHIASVGRGIVVYLPGQDGRGSGLPTLLRSFLLMDQGMTSAKAFAAIGRPQDRRDYRLAVKALRFMGVERLRLITNNPLKLNALTKAGFEVDGRIPSLMDTDDPKLLQYLNAKTELGHMIEER